MLNKTFMIKWSHEYGIKIFFGNDKVWRNLITDNEMSIIVT